MQNEHNACHGPRCYLVRTTGGLYYGPMGTMTRDVDQAKHYFSRRVANTRCEQLFEESGLVADVVIRSSL